MKGGEAAASRSFSSSSLWGHWLGLQAEPVPLFLSLSLSLPFLRPFSLIPPYPSLSQSPDQIARHFLSGVYFMVWMQRFATHAFPPLIASMPASWQGLPTGQVFFSV